jgi:hypothetical protein
MATSASRRSAGAFAFILAAGTLVAGTLITSTVAQAQVSSTAQVILPIAPPVGPPWNAQTVFEPLLYPYIWDRESRADLLPEDLPVRTRQQPGYEPVGVRAGSWMFHPSVAGGTFYDSNVFASSFMKKSDVAAVVAPQLRASTLWERHYIDFEAGVRSLSFRDNPGLDQVDASFRSRARIDVAHDAVILARVQAAYLHERPGGLSSPAGPVEPTPYSLLSGDVTYRKEFNRLTTSFGGLVNSYNYGSTRAQNGTIIDQNSRDGQVYAGHGRVDYAVSPKLGVFSAVDANRRELRGTPDQSLSSSGYRALGGVTIELSRIISGEFGVGYMSQQFDSSLIGTVEGPAYRAMLVWSPTRMWDVYFRAEQVVTQSAETRAFGIRAYALQLGVDYEFRRNVIVSLAGNYENDKFFGSVRDDDVYASYSELKYLLNRTFTVSLRHRYLIRNSSDPTASYDKHEVGLNVTATF